MEVEDEEKDRKWRFTGFYGTPYAQDRVDSWSTLKNLHREEDTPWLVCRDFNEILFDFEKKGGLPREEKRMELFREALDFCQLADVGYSGRWFTWERGNLPETNIQERLDRGVANTSWIFMFPEVRVEHLVHSFSDYCPIFVNTNKEEKWEKMNKFKFEAWWIMATHLLMKLSVYGGWHMEISCRTGKCFEKGSLKGRNRCKGKNREGKNFSQPNCQL